MQSIFDVELTSLTNDLHDMGEAAFHAKQVWQGLYKNLFDDWKYFTSLSKTVRETFAGQYRIKSLAVVRQTNSKDGKTQKILFRLPDGKTIESVLMSSQKRNTVCISTQSGCAMRCSFCATGQMGLKRNLTSGEIIEQVVYFQRYLKEFNSSITNVVLMGMGEPFLNYLNVKRSLAILNNADGFGLGARHFTISTIGIPPVILDFANDFPQMNLAVSLHAPSNILRDELVPMNKTYPLERVISTCKDYIKISNRRISFEYVLLNGMNDSTENARELVGMLKGILCHVNLIPFNKIQNSNFQPSTSERTRNFFQLIENTGIPITIRQSLGQEIDAGCGQLAGHPY
jgi:23S rRNA (adenine2503-C2)-methyltransferase